MPHTRFIATLLLGVLAAAPALALPEAPTGWHSERAGTQQVYRSNGDAFAEVRLFAPEPTHSDRVEDWLAERSKRAVKGASVLQQRGETQVSKGFIAFSESLAQDKQGNKMSLVRGGCFASAGQALYGEMLMSAKASYDEGIVNAGLEILTRACMEAAKGQQGQTPPASAKPSKGSDEPEPYAFYKPGAGLKATQIEAIVHSWTNEQAGMTMQVVDHYYVLLKDGTYRKAIPPVAFEDFDAEASQAGEPAQWGKWRKRQGQYEVSASTDADARFSAIPRQTVRGPARKDERLAGTWQHDSAYSSAWSVARSSRSVRFSQDGRFERSFASSVVGGAGSDAAGTAVHGATQRTDDCARGTMGGANYGAGSSRCRASTAPDRSGTYRLDGYTMTLHYDNGQVERLPFCTRDDRGDIWFAGWAMSRKKAGE